MKNLAYQRGDGEWVMKVWLVEAEPHSATGCMTIPFEGPLATLVRALLQLQSYVPLDLRRDIRFEICTPAVASNPDDGVQPMFRAWYERPATAEEIMEAERREAWDALALEKKEKRLLVDLLSKHAKEGVFYDGDVLVVTARRSDPDLGGE